MACALAKLEWSGTRALAVVEDDAVVGVVDTRMLIGVRASARRPVKVGDVMSAAVATAPRSAGPLEWARLFETYRLDGIAIVDGGVVVGLVYPTPAPAPKRRGSPPGARRR